MAHQVIYFSGLQHFAYTVNQDFYASLSVPDGPRGTIREIVAVYAVAMQDVLMLFSICFATPVIENG